MDNVEGAQKELLKYWSRVSSNRWLIAKMFGVLVCAIPFLTRQSNANHQLDDLFPALGVDRRVDMHWSQHFYLFFSLYSTCFHVVLALESS